MVAVLTLDIATSMGWAIRVDGFIKGSGTYSLSRGNENHQGKRLRRLHDDFLSRFSFVNEIVIEKVAVFGSAAQSQNQVKLYYQAHGIINYFAAGLRIPVSEYHISTWKKALTGNGRATKEDVGYVLQHHYGWAGAVWTPDGKLANNDEADALALQFVHAMAADEQIGFGHGKKV